MKKFLAMILALVMALSLVACGGGGSDAKDNVGASGETDKDVYIDFWGVWAQDNYRAMYWQEKAEEFAAAYEAETGTSVCIEYYGQGSYGELSEKLAAGSASGQLPVISQVEEQATARFYPLAADLSTLLKKETIDDYLDGLLVSCTQQGKLVAVPAGRSYIVATVNKTLLEQAGHSVEELEDWTWEDMHQIAKDISALGDGYYGHAQYWDEDAWPWESAVYSNGGSIDNEDGTKVVFDEASATPILDLAVEMMLDGSSYSGYTDFAPGDVGDSGFYPIWAEGKLGMYIGSITMYKTGMKHRDAEPGNDFEIVVAKQPAGKAGFSVVTGGSNMMIMNSATDKQKEVAAAYFEYLAKPENVAGWNATSGYMAFTESVENDPAFAATTAADPNLLNIYKFVEDAHARPTTPYWQDMYLNVLMHGLVDLSQNPSNYATHDKTAALVAQWAKDCQKILDDAA